MFHFAGLPLRFAPEPDRFTIVGCPIRIYTDQRLLAISPYLFAGCYVLHRLFMSRHPSYTLTFHLMLNDVIEIFFSPLTRKKSFFLFSCFVKHQARLRSTQLYTHSDSIDLLFNNLFYCNLKFWLQNYKSSSAYIGI